MRARKITHAPLGKRVNVIDGGSAKREPQWSSVEIAEKLGVTTQALRGLITQHGPLEPTIVLKSRVYMSQSTYYSRSDAIAFMRRVRESKATA